MNAFGKRVHQKPEGFLHIDLMIVKRGVVAEWLHMKSAGHRRALVKNSLSKTLWSLTGVAGTDQKICKL